MHLIGNPFLLLSIKLFEGGEFIDRKFDEISEPDLLHFVTKFLKALIAEEVDLFVK